MNPNAPEAEPTSAEVEAVFHTNWRFECNPGCDGGEGVLNADNTAHAVEHEAHIFIHPNQTYTLKLTAENGGGKTVVETTFNTPKVTPAVSYVTSAPTSLVTDTEARLQGVIDPRASGNITDCHFIYGTGGVLDEEAPCAAQNEMQFVFISGEVGQFRLTFEGEETGDLALDAPAENVQSALESLSTIGAGNVSVKGGPGGQNTNGDVPYVVTFQGALTSTNVPELSGQSGTEPLNGSVSINTQMEGGSALTVVNAHPDRDSLVGAAISGLTPGAEYEFRLVTANSTGPVQGGREDSSPSRPRRQIRNARTKRSGKNSGRRWCPTAGPGSW